MRIVYRLYSTHRNGNEAVNLVLVDKPDNINCSNESIKYIDYDRVESSTSCYTLKQACRDK